MVCHIETSREPDGRWVAKVPALEGLQIYGYSQEETLAEARKVSAMLLYGGNRRDQRILVFYPGRLPDSAGSAGQP
jgi:predicted RNase H-like HicB family nuclease